MTNKHSQTAYSMWETNQHAEAVRIGLANIKVFKFKNSQQFCERLMNLIYGLISASELKLFNEFKLIFPEYINTINTNIQAEPPCGYRNHVCLMQHNLMATLFQLYENKCQLTDVRAALQLLQQWTDRAPDKTIFDEVNLKLIRLAELILNDSKNPYFTIKFSLPFSLPLPNGTYEVRAIRNIESIAIEHLISQGDTSRIGDRHFCRVTVRMTGFTSTDNYWHGPDIDSVDQEPRNSRLALHVVNQIILRVKLLDESMRMVLASIQDIGTVTTVQHNGEGEIFHSAIAMTFGGHALVNVLTKQELNEENLKKLEYSLNNLTPCLHDELYSRALIERGNMNLISAFYLLNSANEAMIEHFIFSFAETNGKIDLYNEFMEGASECQQCDLFKAQPVVPIPRRAMPPSPFSMLKFLKTLNLASPNEVRDLLSALSKVRSDKWRNDLIHGRTSHVPRKVVDDAIKGFQELKKFFDSKAQISE